MKPAGPEINLKKVLRAVDWVALGVASYVGATMVGLIVVSSVGVMTVGPCVVWDILNGSSKDFLNRMAHESQPRITLFVVAVCAA